VCRAVSPIVGLVLRFFVSRAVAVVVGRRRRPPRWVV